MNPFSPNAMPVRDSQRLLFREETVDKLHNCINSRSQTVVQGVEGVGKTSLLQSAFDLTYRREQACSGVLITPVSTFPEKDELDDEKVYDFFIDAIMGALEVLEFCGDTEKEALYGKLYPVCSAIKNDPSKPPEKRLRELKNKLISNGGLHVVMVIDNFEHFLLSPNVKMEHHEALRSKLDVDTLQFVVATNYDLNKDTLPQNVSGSFFVTNFGKEPILPSGWTLAQVKRYLLEKLQGHTVGSFSEELLCRIYALSGGIPKLLEQVAHHAYEYVKEKGSEDGWCFPLEQDLGLPSHWCRILSEKQITALQHLAADAVTADDKTAITALFQRGVLVKKLVADTFGNVHPDSVKRDFCCEILKEQCRKDGWLAAIVDKSTPEKAEADSGCFITKEELGDLFDKKQDALQERQAAMETTAKAKIDEYAALGRLRANSRRMKGFREHYDAVSAAAECIDNKFDMLRSRLLQAGTEAELLMLKRVAEEIFNELELKLDAIERSE